MIRLTLEDRWIDVRRDLVARLKWAYPSRDPLQHMKSPAWVKDLAAWHSLGEKKRR